jgi:hypothetical protein
LQGSRTQISCWATLGCPENGRAGFAIYSARFFEDRRVLELTFQEVVSYVGSQGHRFFYRPPYYPVDQDVLSLARVRGNALRDRREHSSLAILRVAFLPQLPDPKPEGPRNLARLMLSPIRRNDLMITNRKESTATLVVFMKTAPRCLTANRGQHHVHQEKAMQEVSSISVRQKVLPSPNNRRPSISVLQSGSRSSGPLPIPRTS